MAWEYHPKLIGQPINVWDNRRRMVAPQRVVAMTASGEHGMNSQDRIIRSAIALFGERGYEATSLKDIGAHAGHAAGLISHHFKTKAGLFLICGLTVLDEFNEELGKAVQRTPTGLEAVLAYSSAFFRFASERRSAYLVLAKLSPFSVSRPELSSDELLWKMRAMLRLLSDALERGLRDGTVSPLRLDDKEEADAETYGLTVFSMVLGTARTLVISPFAQARQKEAALAFLRESLHSCKNAQGLEEQ